jgi:hypothetical protein
MIDPPTAAAMAIQSVIGRSVTPMTPAPQDLGPGRLPGEEHTPAKDVKSDSQLNFGDY